MAAVALPLVGEWSNPNSKIDFWGWEHFQLINHNKSLDVFFFSWVLGLMSEKMRGEYFAIKLVSTVMFYTIVFKVRVLVCYGKYIGIMPIIAIESRFHSRNYILVILWYSNEHLKCLLIFNLYCYRSNIWPVKV